MCVLSCERAVVLIKRLCGTFYRALQRAVFRCMAAIIRFVCNYGSVVFGAVDIFEEYSLSDGGKELYPIFYDMAEWCSKYL